MSRSFLQMKCYCISVAELLAAQSQGPTSKKVLVCTLLVAEGESNYARGTILLADPQGTSVVAHLTNFQAAWIGKIVCIREWSFIQVEFRDTDPPQNSNFIEVRGDQVRLLPSNWQAKLNASPGTPVDDYALTQLLLPLPNDPSSTTVDTLKRSPPQTLNRLFLSPSDHGFHTILARVHAKSVLVLRSGARALFLLEIRECPAVVAERGSCASGFYVAYVVFKGDTLTRHHSEIDVGKDYVFTRLQALTMLSGRPDEREVLVFQEGKSAMKEVVLKEEALEVIRRLVGESEETCFVEQMSSMELTDSTMVSKAAALVLHHPTSTSTPSSSRTITYTGRITRHIDPILGLFLLDDTYILSLSHYSDYFPAFSYRIGTQLCIHHVHVVVLDITLEAMERILTAEETDVDGQDGSGHPSNPNTDGASKRHIVFIACSYTTVKIVAFPPALTDPERSPITVIRLPCQQKKFFAIIRFRLSAVDLLRCYDLYLALVVKFPDAFDNARLLVENNKDADRRDAAASLLLDTMGAVYGSPWPEAAPKRHIHTEFFEHETSCRVAAEQHGLEAENRSGVVSIRGVPTIRSFLEDMKRRYLPVDALNTMDFSRDHDRCSFVTHTYKASDDEAPCLLGILQGGADGVLYLRDKSAGIPVVAVSGTRVETFDLGHMWLVREFEVVIEKLGMDISQTAGISGTNRVEPARGWLSKVYVRLDLRSAVCVCVRDAIAKRVEVSQGYGAEVAAASVRRLGERTVGNNISGQRTRTEPKFVVFQVHHVHLIRACCTASGGMELRCHVEGLRFRTKAESEAQDVQRTEVCDLAMTSPRKTVLTFASSNGSLRWLPALRVGGWYRVGVGGAAREEEEDPDEEAVMLIAMGGEEAEGWMLDVVKVVGVEHEEGGGEVKDSERKRDFFDNVLQPVTLRTDELSMNLYRLAKQALSTQENAMIDVSDVLNFRRTRQDPVPTARASLASHGYLEDMVSFRGVVTAKEFRSNRPFAGPYGSPASARALLDDFNIGTGRPGRILFLRVRDARGVDSIDVYVNIIRNAYPLGLLPGAGVVFRRVARKMAKTGAMYCHVLACTHVAAEEEAPDVADDADESVYQRLETRKLVDFVDEKTAPRIVCRLFVRVKGVVEANVRWVCKGCESNIVRGACKAGCRTAGKKFLAEAKFMIVDGTAEALVYVDGEEDVLRMLRVWDRRDGWSIEELKGVAEEAGGLVYRTREEGEEGGGGAIFAVEEKRESAGYRRRILRRWCMDSRVCDYVTLYVKKMHWKRNAAWVDGASDPLAGMGEEFGVHTFKVGSSSAAGPIWTLKRNKIFLKVVRVEQEVSVVREGMRLAMELVKGLEEDG
ncbi:CST, telomere maintenance, complex subunit CTC1-domain-containing protein [Jimgerdemannia flammicorona]|uniref:CST complex subunit CTC1 n=1 Tax=Jimgerdemannia flammicorona TaxID=994334 RepID=A0A433D4H4_9FUNG|nr:CST, telomere maintenance, complex subunit CTC1-domain-containing protein [Jimgerdemannia flammicorona]